MSSYLLLLNYFKFPEISSIREYFVVIFDIKSEYFTLWALSSFKSEAEQLVYSIKISFYVTEFDTTACLPLMFQPI